MNETYLDGYVRTISCALAQAAAQLDKPHIPLPYTTQNELLDIHKGEVVADSDNWAVRYAMIGIGGHDFTYGADSIPLLETIPHTPRHTGMYKPMPFVLRKPNDDLTAAERAKYRLRRLEEHNGETYVAYYAMALNIVDVVPRAELRKTVNGETVSTPFTPSLADLRPTRPQLTESMKLTTTGDYLAATTKVNFSLSPAEIEEFQKVCQIIYGSINYAIISELALCQGVERALPGDFNGQVIQYQESIGMQVAYFISSSFQTVTTNRKIDITFDIGTVEPLLEITVN